MASNGSHAWRFAPLNPENGATSLKPSLKGIVFDVDGTLCAPQNYMFGEMREALGISKSVDILDHLHSLPMEQQEEAFDKVKVIERRAMKQQTPQPGLSELMTYLGSRGVRRAICTRNFDEPVNHLLTHFIAVHEFSPIITRSFKPPKPSPAGILHIAREWKIDDEERADHLIMVGDSIDDMKAGAGAGALTVLLESDANQDLKQHECTDISIKRSVERPPDTCHGSRMLWCALRCDPVTATQTSLGRLDVAIISNNPRTRIGLTIEVGLTR